MKHGHHQIEFPVPPELTQSFDVWRNRPGIAACKTSWLPGWGWVIAIGSRRGLRALARELFDGPELRENYKYIDSMIQQREEVES